MSIHLGLIFRDGQGVVMRLMKKKKRTEILGVGPELTKAEIQTFFDQFELLSEKHEVICLSGSWPRGAGDDAYFQLIKKGKENKNIFMLTLGKFLKENTEIDLKKVFPPAMDAVKELVKKSSIL